MRIIFRADGNSQIGLGHVVRSLALAAVVQPVAPCFFAVRSPSVAVRSLLQQAGVSLIEVPELSWLAEAHHLADTLLQATDIVVLDGYHFDFAYQQRLKATGCRLVCIDDLHATPFAADLIINHSPGVAASSYTALADTRYCLGPAFSLLRPAFLQRAQLPAPVVAPVQEVVVCFGGADPQQLTFRTVAALLGMPTIQHIAVVLGGAFGADDALQALQAAQPAGRLEIQRNLAAEALATLLLRYPLVVCPASTVLLETLVLGRAAITGYYVDNQRHLAQYVHAHHQAFSLGDLAQLTDAELPAALLQGLHFHETHLRLPYVTELAHTQLRDEFQRLTQP